jgi:uncharacterized protein YbjQ (UPF0145 family)
MAQSATGWGAEVDRIAAGGLAASTVARLDELRKWKGFTSFLSPSALAVGRDMDVGPIGQVVGFSAGQLLEGTLRTTEPGQGRARVGQPRWRERTGPIRSWDAVRRRALARLREQAGLLDANAVVGIKARRWVGGGPSDLLAVEQSFDGTAVRVEGWRRPREAPPVLTLASAEELWLLLRAGIEPAGIAGSFASVHTRVSASSLRLGLGAGRWASSAELADLTKSAYEARRLALERLRADARGLDAHGLIGIDMEHGQRSGGRLPGVEIIVHLLATAVRRRGRSDLEAQPVARLREKVRG